MNELQQIEFNLLCEFDKLCKKMDIKYFLVCGSALGAARHSGFIPWDDDLDVALFRDDYNKFMESAHKYLPEGIFLQNYKTDPQFPYVYAKLRNSNTTFIQSLLSNLDINHGIYIDIFPLDGIPDSIKAQKTLDRYKRHYLRQICSAFNMPSNISLKGKVSVAIFRTLRCHKRTANILSKYEKLISKYSVDKSSLISNHGTWHETDNDIPKHIYGNGRELVFEGINVRVPEKIDEYLTLVYGDWRKLPPVEEQTWSHNCEICDVNKSYKSYL